EQVHRARGTADEVREITRERRRAEHDAIEFARARRRRLLVVEEEEGLVMAVVQAGNRDWTADAGARLLQIDLCLRRLACYRVGRQVAVVEPRVRVQLVVLVVLVRAAADSVRPRARDDLDLRGAA